MQSRDNQIYVTCRIRIVDTKVHSLLDHFTIFQEMSLSSHVTRCREAKGVLSLAQDEHPGCGGKERLTSSFTSSSHSRH